MKKRRWPGILAAVLAAGFLVWYVRAQYFEPMTCGTSEEAMVQYVADRHGWGQPGYQVIPLKTAQNGRAQAMLYEEQPSGDRYIMIFERQLFGLRLKQTGMDMWREEGLHFSGSWRLGGLKGSRCTVEVFGDDRDGNVTGYAMADAPEVQRDDLESDYILDLYDLDGISALPGEFRFMTGGEYGEI